MEQVPERTKGEAKIEEYVESIRSGKKTLESVLEGLPPGWIKAVKEGVSKIMEETEEVVLSLRSDNELVGLVGQWKGIESMNLEDFALKLLAEAKRNEERLLKKNILNAKILGYIVRSRPEYRNLETLLHFPPFDPKPFLKVADENEELIKSFKRASMKEGTLEGVEYVQDSWEDCYAIRYNDALDKKEEIYQGTVNVDKDKILTKFTPNLRHEIVKRLHHSGYHGKVSFVSDGSRALFENSNIILEGGVKDEIIRGLEIVQQVLTEHSLKGDVSKRWILGRDADGKKINYIERVAQIVAQASEDPNIDPQKEIHALSLRSY